MMLGKVMENSTKVTHTHLHTVHVTDGTRSVMGSPDWSCCEYESLYVQATHHHIHAFVKRPKDVFL